jgi:hypothetical protein
MEPAGELVLGIIADAVRDGDLDLGDVPPEEVALGLWSMVVGTHTLVHAAGLLEFFNVKEPYRAMGRNIHGLLNGLGWRPLFTINDGAACERYARRLMSDVFGETADN